MLLPSIFWLYIFGCTQVHGKITTKKELFAAKQRYKPNVEAIATFHDKHKGEAIWIIGNGPSLNKVDVSKLKGKTTIGVNAIYLNKAIKPTYYVIEDSLVALDRQDEINSDVLDGTTRFFGTYLSPIIDEKEGVIFMNVDIDYNSQRENWPLFSTDLRRKVYVGGSVTYISLQLAYWMGASTVYMVGFDHNYIIPSNIIQKDNVLTTVGRDPNHFNSDYFGHGLRWHLPKTDRMARGFYKAKQQFEKHFRHIINTTPEGRLDILDRANFELAVESNVTCADNGLGHVGQDIKEETLAVGLCVVCPTSKNDVLSTRRMLISLATTQNPKPDEIHVNFNGATEKNCKNDPGYKLIAKECSNTNGCYKHFETLPGLSRCKNKIFGVAKTSIVAFIDNDATISKTWTGGILSGFQKSTDCWAVGGPIKHNQDVKTKEWKWQLYWWSKNHFRHGSLNIGNELNIPSDLCHLTSNDRDYPRILGGNAAYRREVPACIGGFDHFLGRNKHWRFGHEENDLTNRIVKNGGEICYHSKMLLYHNQKHRQSGANVDYAMEDAWDLLSKEYILCKHCKPEAVRLEKAQNKLREWMEAASKGMKFTLEDLENKRQELRAICDQFSNPRLRKNRLESAGFLNSLRMSSFVHFFASGFFTKFITVLCLFVVLIRLIIWYWPQLAFLKNQRSAKRV